MATHEDNTTDSSVHTTPTPSLRGKTDVDSHFRLPQPEARDPEQEHEQASSAPPPPFSSHNFPSRYFPAPSPADPFRALVTECAAVEASLATCGPAPPTFEESSFTPTPLPLSLPSPLRYQTGEGASSVHPVFAETKAALPRDTKDPTGASGSKDLDDGEPPPPYSEGGSPIEGFTYIMAGAASVITQVQQGGVGIAPISTSGLGGELLIRGWSFGGCIASKR